MSPESPRRTSCTVASVNKADGDFSKSVGRHEKGQKQICVLRTASMKRTIDIPNIPEGEKSELGAQLLETIRQQREIIQEFGIEFQYALLSMGARTPWWRTRIEVIIGLPYQKWGDESCDKGDKVRARGPPLSNFRLNAQTSLTVTHDMANCMLRSLILCEAL